MVGKRLAGYEILERVARGGMGVVYRARHVYMNRVVALKVLDPALAARADLLERFRQEAQALARVEHSNVVKVIDILEDRGVHFIVMDFAPGVDLRRKVRDHGPLSAPELFSIARQAAEALLAAHREGILHRDIKPDNLIVNARGRCKLADFGLAGSLRLIREGHEGPLNFGTPAYCPPEVLRRAAADRRSDIFSFGATLYHLAVGSPPFGAGQAQQILLQQRQGAELLEGLRPDLPPGFCALVHRCLDPAPERRPADMQEILDALPSRYDPPSSETDAFSSGPLGETGEQAAPLPWSWVGVAALATGIAGLIVVILAVSLRSRPPAPQMPSPSSAGGGSRRALPRNDDIGSSRREGRPDEEAFGEAEVAFNRGLLEAEELLGAGDYAGAWEIWDRYIEACEDEGLAARARGERDDIELEVKTVRSETLRELADDSEGLLAEGRTAKALALWMEFPENLLDPLWPAEADDLRREIDRQVDGIRQTEGRSLELTLSRAGRLRERGDLLGERRLLEDFVDKVSEGVRPDAEERLTEVREMLEAVEHDALVKVAAGRAFRGERRGEEAEAILAGLRGTISRRMKNRRFDDALEGLTVLAEECDDELLDDLLEEFADDVKLAERALEALHRELRRLERTGREEDFKVHIDDGESMGERLDSVRGVVVSVDDETFKVKGASGKEQIFEKRLVHASTLRRLVRDASADDRLAMAAWLFAVGDDETALAEASRLVRSEGAPQDVVRAALRLEADEALGGNALRRLSYYAAREKRISRSEFVERWGSDALESRLLAAQAGVERGEASRAAEFLALGGEPSAAELISPEALESALALAGEIAEEDLKLWIAIEPENPAACTALARWYENAGERKLAKVYAQAALALNPADETAWEIAYGEP